LPKIENLKMMLGARGLEDTWWVQGKALVRGPRAPGSSWV